MVALTSDQQTVAREIIRKPMYFLRDVLGATPYRKQREISEAVATSRRISVVGCNGSGKDWAAARMALWWMASRYPAKVIITGPTGRQVNDIVWNELRSAYNNSLSPLGGTLYDSSRLRLDEEHFAVGFSTDDPYGLQGYHSPDLMVIVTEAHAMRQVDIEALRRLNPNCFLITGNPFVQAGELYNSHHTSRHLYSTIQISAFDTPNLTSGKVVVPGLVTRQDVEDRREEWGEDDPLYIGGVLGQFPENLDDNIVTLAAAMAAAKRETIGEGPVILACDVARFGRDKTVIVKRQGARAEIIWRVRGRDTQQVAGWIGAYLDPSDDTVGPTGSDIDVEAVVIDDTGVGGGVTDRLRENGTGSARLVAFIGGAGAKRSERYANAISEAWWKMRKWLVEEGSDACIPDDPALVGQLTSRGFDFVGDKTIRIHSKKDMAKSPDEADALAMTFAADRGWAGLRFFE
jgi:phage terminase large subunit